MNKPLNAKAYGHIPHLPGSRMGPADQHCHEGQARICTEKARDRHDMIVVQVKLDGSCCAVAKVGGKIVALGRAGWLAETSKFLQHQWFARWVRERTAFFDEKLSEGERFVGEWLAQAHGTRYALPHEPFAVFDLMIGTKRSTLAELDARIGDLLPRPFTFSVGGPVSIEDAMHQVEPLSRTVHGSLDPAEGVVWRVERRGKVDFLAKYVRPDKVDGAYLPEQSGEGAVWNWRPENQRAQTA